MRTTEQIKDDIIINYQEQIEILKSINDKNETIIKIYKDQKIRSEILIELLKQR